MFHRVFDEGLAQSSYVIGCDRTRQAAVVDPRRDVDVYVDLARQHRLALTLAIETHVHADFVSGARELSLVGAKTIAGPGAALACEHDEAGDGETFRVGDVALTALHTPGHTPEHLSLLVDQPGSVRRVLTGDTLFVGAVGRPDLLGADAARGLAEQLYDSIYGRLLALDDHVELHPGHGAGSLCGTAIGREAHSTIGQERRFNRMLQYQSKESFVRAVLADLPQTPPYFAELKRLNRRGPSILNFAAGAPAIPPLRPADAAAAMERGAILIDMRPPDVFANGHPRSALNMGFGSRIGYWAGWLIPLSTTVVLMSDGDPRQVEEAGRQLRRVGVDTIAGFVEGSFAAWRAAELPVSMLTLISARDLHGRESHAPAFTLVDVRTQHEFDEGHIAGALHVPLGSLLARVADIPRTLPVATVCEGGYRSMLAASLLARAGFAPVFNIAGGMTSYRALETAAGL